MDKEFNDRLQLLSKLQGKKVAWTGFDPETQAMTILFEDKTGINIEGEIMEVADVEQFIDATLAENGLAAKQILKLEGLFPKKEATLLEAAAAATAKEAEFVENASQA